MLLEIVPVRPLFNKLSRELLNVDFVQISPMFQESLGVSGPVRGIIEIHHLVQQFHFISAYQSGSRLRLTSDRFPSVLAV